MLGIDEPTYLSVHSAVSSLAPQVSALVHVARYLAPGENPTPAHFGRLEAIFDLLQSDWRNLVVAEQRLSEATVAHDFPTSGPMGRRASGSLADAPGVFIAGDWIGDAGMLADASAASARSAAIAALERL